MEENKKSYLHQQKNAADHIENSIPFPGNEGLCLNPEGLENIINIRLSSSGQNHINSRIPVQPCQTTINLYINDPHIMQKSCDKYKTAPYRRKIRNDIVLGKSIPNHALMKELLGDLGVKKYSSAPNMTNKLTTSQVRIPFDGSEGSSTYSTEAISQEEICKRQSMENQRRKVFPYLNERKSCGDYLIEKNIDIQRGTNNVGEKVNTAAEENEKPILKDPMKRFRRKPFGCSLINRNPPVPHQDTIAEQVNTEQSERSQHSVNIRTRMVKDILNSQPALMDSYQCDLMRNHKKLFDCMRQKSFQEIPEEVEVIEKEEQLRNIQESRKIDSLDVKQTKLIFLGKRHRPPCSVESHGPYEEYRKNLVKAPDGSLCCRNIDLKDDDEEIWSRAATRNVITSEFVKNKVKKFDRLIGRFSNDFGGSQNLVDDERIRKGKRPTSNFPYDDVLSSILLNEEQVSFPKETKNAMSRLMSENAKKSVNNFYNTRQEDNKQVIAIKENVPIRRRSSYIPTSACGDVTKTNKNGRCWPGVAERSRSTVTEENTAACGS